MTHRRQSEWLLLIGMIAVAAAIVLIVAYLGSAAALPLGAGTEETMPVPELSNSGVPQDESAILARWYADYAKALKKIVVEPPGGTAASQEFHRARAAQLVEQVEALRIDLGAKVSLWVGRNMPRAYRDGRVAAERQAKELGVAVPPIKGSFSVIHARPLQILARDAVADLQTGADMAAKRAKSILRVTSQLKLGEAQINRILAGGIVEGAPAKTVRQLRDELVKVHGETVPVVDKNGDVINFKPRHYAEMVVRSKTREANVTARHERLEEVGLDLVMIIGRRSTNPCSAFLDQVFSLSGKSDKYPAFAQLPGGGPPFHPNCTKSTRPFVERLASPRQLEKAEGLADAQKLLGKDFATAGRLYKDLQIHAQVRANEAKSAAELLS